MNLNLALTIAGFTLTVAVILWRGGRLEQRLTSKIEHIEIGLSEEKEARSKLVEDLNLHSGNQQIHINMEIERRLYEERREWMRRVEAMLDEIRKAR